MARVSVQVPVEKPSGEHEPAAGQPSAGMNRYVTKNNLLIGGAILIVILLGVLLNDRNRLKTELKKESTTQNAQTDAQKYQDAVTKLVEVPSGITPAVKIPTQDEITTLAKDNSLYNTAKVGDVFLVYTNQDKSLFLVIYRPSDSKVVLAAQASTSATTKP